MSSGGYNQFYKHAQPRVEVPSHLTGQERAAHIQREVTKQWHALSDEERVRHAHADTNGARAKAEPAKASRMNAWSMYLTWAATQPAWGSSGVTLGEERGPRSQEDAASNWHAMSQRERGKWKEEAGRKNHEVDKQRGVDKPNSTPKSRSGKRKPKKAVQQGRTQKTAEGKAAEQTEREVAEKHAAEQAAAAAAAAPAAPAAPARARKRPKLRPPPVNWETTRLRVTQAGEGYDSESTDDGAAAAAPPLVVATPGYGLAPASALPAATGRRRSERVLDGASGAGAAGADDGDHDPAWDLGPVVLPPPLPRRARVPKVTVTRRKEKTAEALV